MNWLVFAIVAGQLALIWHLLKKSSAASAKAEVAEKSVADLLHGIEARDKTLTKLETDLQRERAAGNMAARQRDDLLKQFAARGDLHAVAAGIRTELQALSALSRMPDRSTENRGDTSPVHGTPPDPPKRP
jgi:hypothetical protein